MPFTGRPHLGREAELEHLQRRLDLARAGEGGVVVVRGPFGTGTTRFAHEVAARADRNDMLVLWGRCFEGLMGRPYGGLADALEEYGTSLDPAALEQQLGPGAPPLARLAPGLRSVVPHIAPPAPLDAADERLRVEEAVVGWLERASSERPLLLVVDDLQWADEDLLWLLRRIRRAAEDGRLLVLGTESRFRRTTAADETPTTGDGAVMADLATEIVDLGGLDASAIGALLAQEFAQPLRPTIVEALAEASAGVPLYARHLLRHLAEMGTAGTLGSPKPTPGPFPADFAELLAWRVSRLGPQAGPVLNALACFPRGASLSVLAAVCRLSRPRTLEALEEVLTIGLARAIDSGELFVVDHDLVRLTVLAGLAPPRLADLHGRAAEALETEYGQHSREHAGDLAEHYHRAASADDRGIRYCVVAAEQARAAGAYLRGVRALEMALGLAPADDRVLRASLAIRLAVAQVDAGLVSDGLASASTALELAARTPGTLSDTLAGVVDTIRGVRSAGAAAHRQLEARIASLRATALELAQRSDELTRTRLQALGGSWSPLEVGWVRWLHWLEADPAAARRLEHGDEVDVDIAIPAAAARTREQTARLLPVARRGRRPATVLHCLRSLAFDLLTRHGLFREGDAWAGQYLAAAERYGSLRDQVHALSLIARSRAVLGRLDDARDALTSGREILAPLEQEPDLTRECLLAEATIAHYADGDWASLIDRLVTSATDQPVAHGLAMAAEEALALVRSGSEQEAIAKLPSLVEAASHQQALSYYRDAALMSSLAAAWELRTAEHAAVGRTLIEQARTAGVGTQPSASLDMAQARIQALTGDVEGARALFARVRGELAGTGLTPLAAIADHDEAIALAAAGSAWFPTAEQLLAQAAERFERLAMDGWAARSRQLLDGGLPGAGQPGGRRTNY